MAIFEHGEGSKSPEPGYLEDYTTITGATLFADGILHNIDENYNSKRDIHAPERKQTRKEKGQYTENERWHG